MARVCSIADVLLVHLKKDPLFEITIPSKTLAYLACGKPLLMAVEGDAADLVAAAGAGPACAAEDPAAMAAAVMGLHAMSAQARNAMGSAGRAYFEGHCTLDIVAEAYERLLAGIRRR
jgi:glycosyltransferase involved in cell wall biosynthesis